MNLIDQNREFDKKRYKEQANIVYISTFFAFFFIIPLFFFSGNTVILAINFFSMAVAVLVFYLNRKERYGLASLIFIATITLQTTIEIMIFGLEPGFAYYYFNMSVLIVYSQWKGWMKLLGISIEALLFIMLFILYQHRAPITQMSQWLTITFHTINVIFNVVGVANSSNFYQIIASDAHKKVSQLATTDYLTNIPNRTAFGTYIDQMAKQHKKHAEASGIMMIDIDHFKNINDTYGHVTGDVILKEIAKTLKTYLVGEDFLGRYGGEEFVFIKHNISEIAFFQLCEKIRIDIEAKHFIVEQEVLYITVSIGALYNSEAHHVDCHEAVKHADALLYQAKRSGRNVVKTKTI